MEEKRTDDLLRFHGFVIHSRPRTGEPEWRLKNSVMKEQEALKIVEKCARCLEDKVAK